MSEQKKLLNKRILITGASQGLGFQVAADCLREGARVAVCSRDRSSLTAAVDELRRMAPETEIVYSTVDVSKQNEIVQFTHELVGRWGGLDVLVANAGIYGPKGAFEEVDWQEWAKAIEINLLGTALSCRAVIPIMKKQSQGKIVILSGGGATKPMPFLSAYATSKAGVVRLAETLAEELKPFHIDVNSVAPGALATRMLDEVIAAGPDKIGESFYQQMLKVKKEGGTPLEIGSSLCVYLASELSDGVSGRLLSAVWDPWQDLQKYKSQIEKTDIYTLRRIVPEDRGQKWEL